MPDNCSAEHCCAESATIIKVDARIAASGPLLREILLCLAISHLRSTRKNGGRQKKNKDHVFFFFLTDDCNGLVHRQRGSGYAERCPRWEEADDRWRCDRDAREEKEGRQAKARW
jgi:hypothetical protein